MKTGNCLKILEAFAKAAQWRVGAHAKALNLPMSEAESSDYELLRRLGKGDEAAFQALYQRYQGVIYRFALHMGGSSAAANDTTQEVFMLLIANSKGYDPAKGSVGNYLFGMARNLARRSLQATRLEVPLALEMSMDDESGEGEAAFAAGDADALEQLTNAEALDCLRKAVLALPETYREIVVLCDLEEMSYAQAGEVLGCSPGTVASRLHRGRSLLKAKLKSQPCVK
ncbi:MAG TPA: RNA polymerase sigma factor [Terriglobales bacterium]|nr:RNA polymerase sigma factor [Terriglobales bacterium]